MEPDEIELGYVPAFRDGVERVQVGDEAILYETETGGIHQLNPIAAVVTGFFDGERTLEGVIVALDGEFDEHRAVIEEDVTALTRELAHKGLLDGVSPTARDLTADGD